MKVTAFTCATLCILLGGTAVEAHHGFYGQYALDEPFDFTGTVVAVEWVNPHAFVLIETGHEGLKKLIRVELKGLRQLAAKGWAGDELKTGTGVRVINASASLDEKSALVCCARIYDLDGREFYTDPRTGSSTR